MPNSEFAYFSSKSGKHMNQMSNPPFWGDVGVKKWSQFLDLGARSPIFIVHHSANKYNVFSEYIVLSLRILMPVSASMVRVESVN